MGPVKVVAIRQVYGYSYHPLYLTCTKGKLMASHLSTLKETTPSTCRWWALSMTRQGRVMIFSRPNKSQYNSYYKEWKTTRSSGIICFIAQAGSSNSQSALSTYFISNSNQMANPPQHWTGLTILSTSPILIPRPEPQYQQSEPLRLTRRLVTSNPQSHPQRQRFVTYNGKLTELCN